MNAVLPQSCHLVRSEAEWRDRRFSLLSSHTPCFSPCHTQSYNNYDFVRTLLVVELVLANKLTVPRISLVLREMWDTTAAGREILGHKTST